MVFTNTEQLYDVFLYAGFGFLLCLYNDIFRIRRRLSRPHPVALFLQDMFLCVSSFLLFFLFALTVNGAQLRLIPLLACAAGFAAARMTVSRLLLAAAGWLIRVYRRVAKAVRAAFAAVLRPLSAAAAVCKRALSEKTRILAKKAAEIFKKRVAKKDKEGV